MCGHEQREGRLGAVHDILTPSRHSRRGARVEACQQRPPGTGRVTRRQIGMRQARGDAARQHLPAQPRSLRDIERAPGRGLLARQVEGQWIRHADIERGQVRYQQGRARRPGGQAPGGVGAGQHRLHPRHGAGVGGEHAAILVALVEAHCTEGGVHSLVIDGGGGAERGDEGHATALPRALALVERA
ncbi:hypothetical protein WR25_10154 [Diploscapter pachys]|uniref:Uncharacterized protein n=1 Tax=Diploscapter pachys TaxID=2018661 RepID=A0A2A2K213_9BILA|nr:hypothetical protein WR25_10154 [Diploscapter pachys]